MVRRFFLAWCVLASSVVSGQPTYVLQGQKFHLQPDIPGQPEEILWKHNGNKVVEFNGKEEEVYGNHRHRVILDWVTAELEISDFRSEDSGEYELEAYRENQLYYFRSTLQVIGRVAKPTISCDLSNGSSNTHETQATLTCSAEPSHPPSVLKYEWQSHGNVLLGPKLTINIKDEDADQIHTCMVSNPLTNEKATFTSKSCYPDPTKALVASLVTIFIVLIVVALVIVFCKLKRKACFAKKNKRQKQRSPAESKHLLDQAPTLPSHQRLGHFQGDRNMKVVVSSHSQDPDNGHNRGEGSVRQLIAFFTPKSDGQASPPDPQRSLKKNADQGEAAISSPSPLGRKLSFCQDQDGPVRNDKADVDEDQLRRNLGDDFEMEPDPAGVLDDGQDTQSDVEPFLEQPESEKKDDENEEAESPPANGNSPPPADTCPPLTQSSPDMRTGQGANSDQENVRESHSTGLSKSTRSDDFSEEEQLSSRGSETALHAQDPNLSQRDLGKALSEDESESDHESNPKLEKMESELEEDLYLDTSQQPHRSPAEIEPGDSKTDDFEEGLNTEAHADPEQEPENMRRPKSEESEEQSACDTADSEEGEGKPEENKKDQCGPKEEKTEPQHD